MKTTHLLVILFFLLLGGQADAQIFKKLGNKVERAAERTVERRVEKETRKSTNRALDSVIETPKKKKKKSKEKNIIGIQKDSITKPDNGKSSNNYLKN